MKLQKIAALVMVVVLAVSMLASCGGFDDVEDDSNSSSSSTGSSSAPDGSSSSSNSSSTIPPIGADNAVLNELINGVKKQLKPQIDDLLGEMKNYGEPAWEGWIKGLMEIDFEESEAAAIVAVMRSDEFQVDANTTILTSLNNAVNIAASILEDRIVDDADLASNQATMIVWDIADNAKYFKNGLGAFVVAKDQWEVGRKQTEETLAELIAVYKVVEAGIAGTSNPFGFTYKMGLASFTSSDGTEYYILGIGVKPAEKVENNF